MPKKQPINVYGFAFDTLSDLTTLLGYKGKRAKNQLIEIYGSLEQMVKTRFRVQSDDQARLMLQKLINDATGVKGINAAQKTETQDANATHTDDDVSKCVKAYIKDLINKGDDNVLDALILAFGVDKNAVLKQIEYLKSDVLGG